jgi:hypothetical protein
MPNAAVRANARAMPKGARKPIAAPTAAQSPLQRATTDLVRAVDELDGLRSLIKAAQMAARDIEDSGAVGPMVELLEVILKRLEATSEKVDAARSQKEHANV